MKLSHLSLSSINLDALETQHFEFLLMAECEPPGTTKMVLYEVSVMPVCHMGGHIK